MDLVGPAHRLGDFIAERGLEGQVGAILSSHNIEHMPDPIGFLQGAARATPPGSRPYKDAHCWVFTPSSFALLVNDAGFLGYHPLRFRRRHPAFGHEFIAHLEKPAQPTPWDEGAFYDQRAALMRAAVRELAASGGRFTPLGVRAEAWARALARRLR